MVTWLTLLLSSLLSCTGGKTDPGERLGVHVEWATGLHPHMSFQPRHWTQGGCARAPAKTEQGTWNCIEPSYVHLSRQKHHLSSFYWWCRAFRGVKTPTRDFWLFCGSKIQDLWPNLNKNCVLLQLGLRDIPPCPPKIMTKHQMGSLLIVEILICLLCLCPLVWSVHWH